MRYLPSLLAMLALAACSSVPSEPHPNLTILRNQCVKWHDSGAYAAAFAQAAAPASRTLDRYIAQKPVGNRAVVFDIDETLLSNWPYLTSVQFVIDPRTFFVWIRHEKAIPLLPTKAIYDHARAAGIPIFLITGRSEKMRTATIQNLKEAGYEGWSGLYLKPMGYTNPSIIPFKSGIRKMLTDKGYDIILSMGDQYSDLDGGYSRHSFKLPNPFYYLP